MRNKIIFIVLGLVIILGIFGAVIESSEKEENEKISQEVKKEREEKEAAKKQEEKDKKEKEEEEKKKEEAKKKESEEAIQYGIELWQAEEDGTKDFLLREHKENGLIDVGPNNDDYSVMNVVVADEFRLLTEEEKEYLINEMGTGIQNLVGSNFGHLDDDNKPQVHVNFIYSNQETAATQKMGGGWKIK